jgi:20S proteasome subunit beta 3
MSILEYNGGGIVAMVGKNCVAIASDRRYGIKQQTISTNMQKIFQINNKCFIGLSGLATDVQTV